MFPISPASEQLCTALTTYTHSISRLIPSFHPSFINKQDTTPYIFSSATTQLSYYSLKDIFTHLHTPLM